MTLIMPLSSTYLFLIYLSATTWTWPLLVCVVCVFAKLSFKSLFSLVNIIYSKNHQFYDVLQVLKRTISLINYLIETFLIEAVPMSTPPKNELYIELNILLCVHRLVHIIVYRIVHIFICT